MSETNAITVIALSVLPIAAAEVSLEFHPFHGWLFTKIRSGLQKINLLGPPGSSRAPDSFWRIMVVLIIKAAIKALDQMNGRALTSLG